MNCLGRISGIAVKIEALFHFIPGGRAIELEDSTAYLPVGIHARNILALRFALDEFFDGREVVDGETEIVVPVPARDLRDRHGFAGSWDDFHWTMGHYDNQRGNRKVEQRSTRVEGSLRHSTPLRVFTEVFFRHLHVPRFKGIPRNVVAWGRPRDG